MKHRGRKSAAEREVSAQLHALGNGDRVPTSHDFPSPPEHLAPSTRAWWSGIVASHELQPHQLRVLTTCCESWDLKERARGVLAKEGLSYFDGKGMCRSRPEVAIARDAQTAFLRALRELNLDSEVEPPAKFRGGFGITYEQLRGGR